MSNELDDFAQVLMKEVRDEGIRVSEYALRPDATGRIAEAWSAVGAENAAVLIPQIVDDVIFELLDAIDNRELRLVFIREDGTQVDLCQTGELGGWFMTTLSNGWRARFSQERYLTFDKRVLLPPQNTDDDPDFEPVFSKQHLDPK